MTIPIWSLKLVRDAEVQYETRAKVWAPADAAVIAKNIIGDADREQLLVMWLDTKNKVIGATIAATGTIKSTHTTAREVFKAAVMANATSIIIAHNHPSGDPTPSQEDVAFTKEIASAGAILDIPLTDHLVIGDGPIWFKSLRDLGLYDPTKAT